jgi:leader peptidase (prepilin peptidase)/N-methyltransferase
MLAMGESTALAGAVVALVCLCASPLLARWALTAPDPGIRGWWRPSASRRPGWRLLLITAGFGVVVGGFCGVAAGWGAALPAFAVLALLMVPLAVIDIRTHRLPDRLTGSAALGFGALLTLATAGSPPLGAAGRALLAGSLVIVALGLLRIAAPRGLGFGDVKLGGVLGLALGWCGWDAVVPGLLAGFVLGAAVALSLVARRRANLRTAFPFGPSLIIGALAVCAASGAG